MAEGLSNNLLRPATINLSTLADPVFERSINVQVHDATNRTLQQLDLARQMLARQQLDGGELAPRKSSFLQAGGSP
jgi:hypothetical protein